MNDNQLMFTLGLIHDAVNAGREMGTNIMQQIQAEHLTILSELVDIAPEKLWLLFLLVPDWRNAEDVVSQSTVRMRVAGIRTQRLA